MQFFKHFLKYQNNLILIRKSKDVETNDDYSVVDFQNLIKNKENLNYVFSPNTATSYKMRKIYED